MERDVYVWIILHSVMGSLGSVVSNHLVINCQVRISAQRSAIANDVFHIYLFSCRFAIIKAQIARNGIINVLHDSAAVAILTAVFKHTRRK